MNKCRKPAGPVHVFKPMPSTIESAFATCTCGWNTGKSHYTYKYNTYAAWLYHLDGGLTWETAQNKAIKFYPVNLKWTFKQEAATKT